MKTWTQENKGKVLLALILTILIRFSLFFVPTLSNILQYRFELSTPLSSYPRLDNCLFTSQHISTDPLSPLPLTPYASDTCTIPIPIILLGQWIQKIVGVVGLGVYNAENSKIIEKLIFFSFIILADFCVALCLSNLVYYYKIFTVPIPLTKTAFKAIMESETATGTEIDLKLKNNEDNEAKGEKFTKTITSTQPSSSTLKQYTPSSTTFYDTSAMIFYAYLFNPISIISSLGLNSTHLSIFLQISLIYFLIMGQKSLSFFSIITAGLIKGLLITIDPSYLAMTPAIIYLIIFRKNTEFYMNEKFFHNNDQNNKNDQNIQNTSTLPSHYLTNPFTAFILYTTPTVMVYFSFIGIQHMWSNSLGATIDSTTTSLTSFFSSPFTQIDLALNHNPLDTTVFNLKQFFAPLFMHTWSIYFNFIKTRPTIGVLWYFYIQIFDRFRLFYSLIIPAPIIIHALSLTRRLQRYPLFVLSIITTLCTIFHPNPTLQHHILTLTLLYINYPLFAPRLGRMTFLIFAMVHFLVGFITMWYSWIDLGSGNANFVFFQTILFNVFTLFLILEIIGAVRSLQSIPPGLEPGVYNSLMVTKPN